MNSCSMNDICVVVVEGDSVNVIPYHPTVLMSPYHPTVVTTWLPAAKIHRFSITKTEFDYMQIRVNKNKF